MMDDSLADKIAAVFDERGWTVLELEDERGQVCARGAIYVASGFSASPHQWKLSDTRWIGSFGDKVWVEANKITHERFGMPLTTYNDNRARGPEDIVQIFREAEKEVLNRGEH
jgi:hypothetical protein